MVAWCQTKAWRSCLGPPGEAILSHCQSQQLLCAQDEGQGAPGVALTLESPWCGSQCSTSPSSLPKKTELGFHSFPETTSPGRTCPA